MAGRSSRKKRSFLGGVSSLRLGTAAPAARRSIPAEGEQFLVTPKRVEVRKAVPGAVAGGSRSLESRVRRIARYRAPAFSSIFTISV